MYTDVEDFFHIFSQKLKQQNRKEEFGCYWTDEELAKELQSNYWKNDWSNDYRQRCHS